MPPLGHLLLASGTKNATSIGEPAVCGVVISLCPSGPVLSPRIIVFEFVQGNRLLHVEILLSASI
jgi:hypothetical protein